MIAMMIAMMRKSAVAVVPSTVYRCLSVRLLYQFLILSIGFVGSSSFVS